jgi:hypothetical protein
VNFLTQFSFNSSDQPIISGHFAVISVRQLNFLTQSFINSGPETTVAVFETILFQWPFQWFEAILMENGVIIESSFGRSCNPQFKTFNLKSSSLLKSSAFSLALFTSLFKSIFLGRWRQRCQ